MAINQNYSWRIGEKTTPLFIHYDVTTLFLLLYGTSLLFVPYARRVNDMVTANSSVKSLESSFLCCKMLFYCLYVCINLIDIS